MKPTVSLCMIVRNEQENLRACLQPLVGLVDEIILVDTGSADATKAVAAELGAKVYDFPWADDFSAARNESRRHAGGQWIFWMDADDRVDAANREKLARLLAGLTEEQWRQNAVYVMSCVSTVGAEQDSSIAVNHVRLFPNTPDLAWQGRVHEQILPVGPLKAVSLRWSDVIIEHTGYQDPLHRRRKRNRDLRLLQLDYATNPDDAGTLFYLGWTQMELGNMPQALRLLRRSVRREPEPRSPRPRKARSLIVACLNIMGQPLEALEESDAALAVFADDPELLFQRASALRRLGNVAAAETCYLRLLNTRPANYLQFGVEVGLTGARTRHMLGVIYKELGRLAEAEAQFQMALAERPAYSEAWASLGQLYLWTGRLREAEAVIDRLARCPRGQVMSPTLKAQLLVMQRRFDEATCLLEQVVADDRASLWPRMILGELLFELGSDWPRCIQIYEELVELNPGDTAARQRLGQLLRRQGTRAMDGAHSETAAPAAAPPGAFVVAGR